VQRRRNCSPNTSPQVGTVNEGLFFARSVSFVKKNVASKWTRLSEFIIASDPLMWQKITLLLKHLQAVLMSGFMFSVFFFGNVCSFASCRIIVPLLGNEKFCIDENMFFACNIRHECPDLTIIDLAESAEPLSSDAS
jgi:hypothetical protein